MLFLYDPTINTLTETNYEYLMELTGKKKNNLQVLKSVGRKISSINCYLVDEKVTVEQRRAWYEKEIFHNEVWKPISGSDGKYLISCYGRVKRVYKNRTAFSLPYLLSCNPSKQLFIRVRFLGRYDRYPVANLVAYHFIGKPKNNEVLHHKNQIATDNYVANLEYTTRSKVGKKTGFKSRSKPITQLDMKTLEPINEFRSAREAGRNCFLSHQSILNNCNHKSKSTGGFVFMFTDDYEQTFLKS
ncbi:NUMOD4 domain-containing protein [Cytobacillus kochii]|uniref:NUMOD4 domain-containing protein n=1 Tax=Cytobacillus kochii TaxID=859143 RepID=UPI00402AAF8F